MKLPPLTLDLRKAALNAGADNDHINVIVPDEGDHVIARINSVCGSYDHAGEMVDRINHYPRAIDALRALAIIPTMKQGIQQVVHDGWRCRVCKSTFEIGAQEIHSTDCPLKGSKP